MGAAGHIPASVEAGQLGAERLLILFHHMVVDNCPSECGTSFAKASFGGPGARWVNGRKRQQQVQSRMPLSWSQFGGELPWKQCSYK
ncbi:protein of unknown function (plasmid) [Pararobbsia alpina]